MAARRGQCGEEMMGEEERVGWKDRVWGKQKRSTRDCTRSLMPDPTPAIEDDREKAGSSLGTR